MPPAAEVPRSLAGAALRLREGTYLPLSAVCAAYGFTWEWDGFSRDVILRKNGAEARFFLGSSLVFFNNRIENLNAPVKLNRGMIVVPFSFARFFPERRPVPVRIPDKRVTIRKIVLDAGHGGKDPGAVGRGGIYEKDIVLDIAKRLKLELEKEGIEVIMTRDRDVFLSLKERFEIANRAKADLFVSIHANAAKNSSARGFEAFYLSTQYDDFAKAVQIRENAAVQFEADADYENSSDVNAVLWDMMLAENRIQSIEIANSVAANLHSTLQLNTRYVKGAMFYVLKGAQMPAVLLEVGYVTNPQEAAKLVNWYYRQMLAEAIAAGIMRYRERIELTNGFTR